MAAITKPGEVAFGLQLPIQTLTRTLREEWENTATVTDLASIAKAADDSGLDFVGVCDHVAIPNNEYAKHMTTTWYDTVATLSYLAATTTRVRLLSVVWIAAYRHPLITASSFGTLDHLSAGRAILGVGAGHVEAEFDALGIDFSTRGRRLDDTLEALDHVWDDTYVSHDGEFYSYRDVGVGPGPVNGKLTTWIAGGGKAAIRRVGAYGDGFIPFVTQHDEYPALIQGIHAAAEKAGRGGTHFDIGIMPGWMYIGEPPEGLGPRMLSGSAEAIAEELRRERELGGNVFHVRFRGRDLSEYLDQLESFASDVVPLVREG